MLHSWTWGHAIFVWISQTGKWSALCIVASNDVTCLNVLLGNQETWCYYYTCTRRKIAVGRGGGCQECTNLYFRLRATFVGYKSSCKSRSKHSWE